MKKNILLVGALALVLAACGNSADKPAGEMLTNQQKQLKKQVQLQQQVTVETSNLL
ncbi:hypothetical protein [uncultured Anaerococcus sp.]|uniref:hypothetical protein n=1 Tax=uncultured Anaerococcus sp. TaxID=293428 RepID=UPI0028897A1E|nr:hypothetical protein [uncultured Anaerococcus sp.]